MGINEEKLRAWMEQTDKRLDQLECKQEPSEPLIKDEKIRKAIRAWADVLEPDEVEFYGAETWIGLRTTSSETGYLSKFELDCFSSENTLVPFRKYTIDELCGEEETPEPLEPNFIDLDERIKEKAAAEKLYKGENDMHLTEEEK